MFEAVDTALSSAGGCASIQLMSATGGQLNSDKTGLAAATKLERSFQEIRLRGTVRSGVGDGGTSVEALSRASFRGEVPFACLRTRGLEGEASPSNTAWGYSPRRTRIPKRRAPKGTPWGSNPTALPRVWKAAAPPVWSRFFQGAQEHSAYSSLHRTSSKAVQRLLEGLKPKPNLHYSLFALNVVSRITLLAV